MTTKKKKTIIGAAIAVAVILIVVLILVFTNKGKEPNLTVDYFMEKNIAYFDTLESVDVTVTIKHDWKATDKSGTTTGFIDMTANTQRDFKTNNVKTQVIHKSGNDGNESVLYHNLFIINENGEAVKYMQQINNIDSGWILNSENKQLESFAEATDFDYINKYRLGLHLEDEITDVNGVKCYKVSGQIFNIFKIANHYGIAHMLGYWGRPLNSHARVALYFREDNHLLHSFEYDFSEYWKENFEDVYGDGSLINEGYASLNVTYNGFNTVESIIVDEDIRNSAVEQLKDPYDDPIDLEDDLYDVKINGVDFKIGAKIEDLINGYTASPMLFSEEIGKETEDGFYINPHQKFTCSLEDNDGNSFLITGQNITDEVLLFTDCVLIRIEVSADNNVFKNFTLANRITIDTSLKEMREILGPYNMREEFDTFTNLLWRSYIDYTDIHIYLDKESGLMTSLDVYCFDIEKKLGIHKEPEIENQVEENITEPTE